MACFTHERLDFGGVVRRMDCFTHEGNLREEFENYRVVVGEAAEVAGAGEGAEGLEAGVAGIGGGEVRRGEDVFARFQAFQHRAAVNLLPFSLEFDGAGAFRVRRFNSFCRHNLVIEISHRNNSTYPFCQQRIP